MSNARTHADAVKTLLASTGSVYVTRAPANAARPYLVLHPSSPAFDATSYEGSQDVRRYMFQVDAYGDGWDAATDWSGKADDALVNQRVTVAGDSVSRIDKLTAFVASYDDDLPAPLYRAGGVYAYTATTSS